MRRLRYAFLGIPLLGLAELAAHFWFAKRPPSFDEWSTVVPAVRETKREGDLLVVSPGWADPAARRALGDALMPLRDEARPDATRYAHALELSILGEHAHELAGWREESRRSVGKFIAPPAREPVARERALRFRRPRATSRGRRARDRPACGLRVERARTDRRRRARRSPHLPGRALRVRRRSVLQRGSHRHRRRGVPPAPLPVVAPLRPRRDRHALPQGPARRA